MNLEDCIKLDNIRRISAEDFKKEDRETIEKLADILNHFMEQMYNGLQKNINIDNLNREVIFTTVKVNSSGVPTINSKFTSNLNKVVGVSLINCTNKTNSSIYPNAAPFVSFVPISNKIYEIKQITGLSPNYEYILTLELYGQ